MLAVAARCGMRTFVETGTYHGSTARWASTHFDRVVTVERAPSLYDQAISRSAGHDNIEFVLGDSREVLAELLPKLPDRAVFWLDGHWSGGETYGAGDECPLLGELAAIGASHTEHSLFIDDAHLFMSAPPRPHDPEEWPTIDEVIFALQRPEKTYAIAVVENVIVAVPNEARPILVSYAQDINTRAITNDGSRAFVSRGLARIKAVLKERRP